jgi:hypothetical protein
MEYGKNLCLRKKMDPHTQFGNLIGNKLHYTFPFLEGTAYNDFSRLILGSGHITQWKIPYKPIFSVTSTYLQKPGGYAEFSILL